MPARQFAWLTPPTEEHPKGKFHRGSKPMETDEQMQMAVKHHWRDACYQSVYAFEEWKDGRPVKESAIIDRIFFDFDDEERPQNAIDDAAKIACNYTTQWFSGKKGIGMLLHLNPVDIHPSMKAAVLKRTCNAMIENFDLKTADTAVIGDLNRVHRIPNTRHQDTKLYAIPLSGYDLRDRTIVDIEKMAENTRDLVTSTTPSMLHTDYMLAVERTIIKERMDVLIGKNMLSRKFYGDHQMVKPEEKIELIGTIEKLESEAARIEAKNTPRIETTNKWLAEAEETLLTRGQLTNGRDRGEEHKERVHFCKYAHECGWTFRQICGAFINIVDRNGKRCYNKKMTEEQVRSCIR
jgi:hypothetical protein